MLVPAGYSKIKHQVLSIKLDVFAVPKSSNLQNEISVEFFRYPLNI